MEVAKALIATLRERGVKLTRKGDNLEVVTLTGGEGLTPELVTQIKGQKADLLRYLEQLAQGWQRNQGIPKVATNSSYALSPAQFRIWMSSQTEESSAAYNIPFFTVLPGQLDLDRMQEALQRLMVRHESLRTIFKVDEEGTVRQLVLPQEQIGLPFRAEEIPEGKEPMRYIHSRRVEESAKAFRLDEGPLFQMLVWPVTHDQTYLFLNTHHIISDEWSQGIFVRDFIAYYQSGNTTPLPELPVTYKDFAAWQNTLLQGETYEQAKRYWLHRFAGSLPALDLPAQGTRPPVKDFQGNQLMLVIPQADLAPLKQLIQQEEATLYMGLLAAFHVLLYHYTGEQDQIIGSPLSGREHPALENMVGFFINTLPLRNSVDPKASFKEVLRTVKANSLQAFGHQIYSFDQLVSDLKINRQPGRNPLFDVLFGLQNVQEAGHLEEDFTPGKVEVMGPSHAKFDLEFALREQKEGLVCYAIYDARLYQQELMEQLLGHFGKLVATLGQNPAMPVAEALASADILLPQPVNQGYVGEPLAVEDTLVSRFASKVADTPEATAVVHEDRSLTFQELDILSNQLAHFLQTKSEVKAEDRVGIYLERSDWVIVAILAVLKTGGAYVPIDPALPASRRAYIQENSQCQFVLDAEAISAFQENLDQWPSTWDVPAMATDQLAYILYTSGSTGAPKGVLVEHRQVLSLLFQGIPDSLKPTAADRWVLFHNYCFDVSVWEIFGSILYGGRLVIPTDSVVKDSYQLVDFVWQHGITIINQTPTAFYPFQEVVREQELSDNPIRQVMLAGEVLAPGRLAWWAEQFPDSELLNLYGITETTIINTLKRIGEPEIRSNQSNIGVPFANGYFEVLGQEMQRVPVGVWGELYVGGAAIARGYWQRPELTAQRFLEDPHTPGETLYRTGDIGKWNFAGELECIGRVDGQVKVRGFRVELGDIEHHLLQMDGVKEAAVIGREDYHSGATLEAYFVADGALEVHPIREALLALLPPYMVPGVFRQLEQMPLNANGKIDRKTLLALTLETDLNNKTGGAPSTDQELVLAEIWCGLLGQEEVGVEDNFFLLGGDSIKAIQIVSRLRQQGYTLALQDVMSNPELGSMAKKLKSQAAQISQGSVVGAALLTPIQHAMVTDLAPVNADHFHQSIVLHSPEPLHEDALRRSLHTLVAHHDALRLVARQNETGWEQEFLPLGEDSYRLVVEDLRAAEDAAKALGEAGQRMRAGIQLSTGPLFQAGWFTLPDGDRLVLMAHHWVVDGVSWRILLEDLNTLYQGYLAGESPRLPEKTHSFQAWAKGLHTYAQEKQRESAQHYWQALTERAQQNRAPWLAEKPRRYRRTGQVDLQLDRELTRRLMTEIPSIFRTEINDALLASLGAVLQTVWELPQVTVWMEGHGREAIIPQLDISRTVGWFTSAYPVVLDLAEGNAMPHRLIEIKEQLRQVPNKGIDYGILRYLSKAHSVKGHLRPAIEFNFLGDFGGGTSAEATTLAVSGDYVGEEVAADNGAAIPLHVSGLVIDGQLSLSLRYDETVFETETLQQVGEQWQQSLTQLVEEVEQSTPQLTPSDLTYAGLSLTEWNRLNADGSIQDVYTLAPLQSSLYFHWSLGGEPGMYFEQMAYRMRLPALEIEAIRNAYAALVTRYEILRTSFTSDYAGTVLQVVHQSVSTQVPLLVRPVDEEKEAFVERIKQADINRGFDLHIPSQMRLEVLDLGGGEYEFVWSHHHILIDGWCMSILLNDFYALLAAQATGTAVDLPAPRPYSDYVKWLQAIDHGQALDYWRDYLAGYDAVAQVPFAKAIPQAGYQERRALVSLHGDAFQQAQHWTQDESITLSTLVQGVWGYLLGQYCGTEDVVFGAVVSGRPAEIAGVENMVGLFINTIPVRVQVAADDTPLSLLSRLQEQSTAGTGYHYLNLSEVQDLTPLGMDLINHVHIFENYPVQEQVREGLAESNTEATEELEVLGIEVVERTNYDLNFFVAPGTDGLEVSIRYNAQVYDEDAMERLVFHMESLLLQFAQAPAQRLESFSFLNPQEEFQLLETFSGEKRTVSTPQQSLVDQLATAVEATPNHLAIRCGGDTLTYAELDAQSAALAHHLIGHGVQPEDRVAVALPRNTQLLVSLWGILKAGAAYLPVDPNYPQVRKDYILEDSGSRLCLDEAFWANYAAPESLGTLPTVAPQQLAYLIYTSGTTGQPKGVMVEHRQVVAFIDQLPGDLQVGDAEVIAGTTNVT
ncbi:MAG TPA: hypothetical protein DCR93_37640, partial [Cytophagales bacterium]|nr:hypothetical protein [Cytophagales bacterium]